MSAKSRIKFSRRREGVTDYKQRLSMLKARIPRLVVRQTNTKIIAQIVDFTETGDVVLATAISSDLGAFGWKHSIKSVPAAYLTGTLISARAKGKNVKGCILDVGLKTLTKGSRIFAVLKGAVDGGLEIPHSSQKFPSNDRVAGKHISEYKKVDISKDFESVKGKVATATVHVKTEKKAKVPAAKKEKAAAKKQ